MNTEPIISMRDPLQNEGSPFSIGTSYAIDTLERIIPGSSYDLVAINIATLLRNHLNSNKSIRLDQLLALLHRELSVLLEDLTAFLQSSRGKAPKILLYLIDYSKSIPTTVSREMTPPRMDLHRAIQYVLIRQGDLFARHLMIINGIEVQYAPCQRNVLPHKFLLSTIKNMSAGSQVTMISHCPLDYHIGRHIKAFTLVDSHTGKVRKLTDLGVKVFKNDHLPFHPTIHPLIGDKDYLVGSLSRGERKQLFEMAEKRHWDVKTHNSIKQDILSLGFKPQLDLE